MDFISVGCQLVPSLFYVDPGMAGLRFTGRISLKAPGRFSRLGGRFPSDSCCLLRSFHSREWLFTRIPVSGLPSGAAGIDTEALHFSAVVQYPSRQRPAYWFFTRLLNAAVRSARGLRGGGLRTSGACGIRRNGFFYRSPLR